MDASDEPSGPSGLVRLQRASLWLAVAAFLLGLLAAGGCSPFPSGDPAFAWVLHPLLLVIAGACGALAARRGAEIEAERWRLLAEPGITKGERDLAHREAEAERRRAGVAFLLAPAGIGFSLANHFARAGRSWVVDLVLVTALAGFGLGLWLGGRGRGDAGPPPD